MHIFISKLTIIGSDNGLSPGWCHAIIWISARIFLIGPLGTNTSEILSGIQTFSFKKIHLNMLSAKWHPLVSALMCYGIPRLKDDQVVIIYIYTYGTGIWRVRQKITVWYITIIICHTKWLFLEYTVKISLKTNWLWEHCSLNYHSIHHISKEIHGKETPGKIFDHDKGKISQYFLKEFFMYI